MVPVLVNAPAVARRLVDRAPFEVADVRMAPPYDFHTYVNLENWVWIPRGQWHSLSVSENVGPAAVALTATPSKLEVDMGAGGAPLVCRDPGRVWRTWMTDSAKTSCDYTYDNVSTITRSGRYDPDGRFTAVGRLHYQVSWTCSGACSAPAGELGEYPAPNSAPHLVEVRQRQTVVIP